MYGGCAQEGFKSRSSHYGQFIQEEVSLVHTVGHLNSKSFFTEANADYWGYCRGDFCIEYVELTRLWLSNFLDCYPYQEMYFTFHIHSEVKNSGNNSYP